MKILMVIYSLQHGGAERVVANLSSEWTALGWQVSVVTLTSGATDFYRLDIGVERVALDLAYVARGPVSAAVANFRRIFALRKLFRAVRPDVVLGIQSTESVLSILAGLGLSCKVVATEHIYPPMLPIGRFWDFVRRWSYPLAATVVTLTEESRKWAEVNCHCKNATVIPNWISLPIPITEPAIRPEDFVPPGRFVLLGAGRLTAQKGFDLLIDAFARIAAQVPQWDLVIIGDGADRQALERQRTAAGLEHRVIFPGQVGNVSDWYARTDLYVLSSRFEGFGMTLVEAMASGCAAISFDCDAGPRDIIVHGHNGLLVSPVGDVDKLAGALLELMANDVRRAQVASRASAVMQKFAPDKVLAMWQDVFDQTGADTRRHVD